MHPTNPFLTWPVGMIEVAADAYAFVQPNGPQGNAGYSNAGLIVGPDYCVVIDTLATHSMHDAFMAAIRRVTNKPVGRVLLTHHHPDHVLGTHRFLPACVISHHACRTSIQADSNMAQRWARKRAQFASDLQGIPTVFPDLTFGDRVSLHLGEREVDFFHPGVAHTTGDAAAYLPADRLLYAGDLFFNRVCPAAFAGSMTGWLAAIEQILQMDVDTIVPGHGPVSDKRGLRRMADYLQLILDASRQGFDAGAGAEEVAHGMVLGDFGQWADTEERLLEDVRRCFQQFREEAQAPACATV